MPKVTLSSVTAQAEIVQRNIEARATMLFGARSGTAMAAKLKIPTSTFNDRQNNPRRWSLEQLIMVAQALKVPLSWLMADHSGEIKEETV